MKDLCVCVCVCVCVGVFGGGGGGDYLSFVTLTHQGKESLCPAWDWHPGADATGCGIFVELVVGA